MTLLVKVCVLNRICSTSWAKPRHCKEFYKILPKHNFKSQKDNISLYGHPPKQYWHLESVKLIESGLVYFN